MCLYTTLRADDICTVSPQPTEPGLEGPPPPARPVYRQSGRGTEGQAVMLTAQCPLPPTWASTSFPCQGNVTAPKEALRVVQGASVDLLEVSSRL